MAGEPDTVDDGLGGASSNGQGDLERIADPDNYNLRRRLKQLHDAKERCRETKSAAVRLETRRRDFSSQKRDRLVAEDVVDYINELLPVLEKKERVGEFLDEEVEYDRDQTVTVEEFIDSRGTKDDMQTPYGYQVSMKMWTKCNRAFEEIAGAEFEKGSPEPAANPIDPAGRFRNK